MELTAALLVIVASMVEAMKEGKSDEDILIDFSEEEVDGNVITDEELKACLEEAKKLFDLETKGDSGEGEKDTKGAKQNSKGSKPETKTDTKATKASGKAIESNKITANVEKSYTIPKSWENCIVLRQSQNIPGYDQEDQKSVTLKPYKPDVYKRLVKSEGFKGINIKIIHKPQ